jgi:hypothetical protein
MDFHEERARDLARAETRPRAIESGKKTRGLLDRYVSSRRMQSRGDPVTRILWGRIAITLGGLILLVVGIVLALKKG